jgi:4-hydroxybenzoate polyprenyltransferase
LSAALVFVKSKKWSRALLGAFLTYLILFFLGTFPSFLSFAYYELKGIKKITAVNEVDIVDLFGTPFRLFGTEFLSIKYTLAYNLDLIFYPILLALLIILFFMIDRKKLWAIIQNIRFPQIIYHTGLFLTGLGLGYLAYPENFYLSPFSPFALIVLLCSIWLAWTASVVANDIYDYQIDEISNPDRPLQKKVFTVSEYASFGSLLFLLSIIGGLVIGFKFAALLLAYQFIAWAYSAPPFRLKKFPGIATLMSSFASLVVLFMGFTLFSGDLHLRGLSFRIILLVIIALTLSLPIKDLKDIEGDRKYKIWTIPVLLGEERGKLAIAIGLFISFMSSVFFLNEFHLFWWAVLFGGLSFLLVTSKKINPRNIFWWILGTVSIYAFIMTVVVFVG